MADLIPPMLIKLQADVSQLKTGLAQAENAIKGVDKSVQTASSGMTNFATKIKQIGASIGIAFAGTQVLQFGRDVIQQAQEAEAQQQRLYQLMKVGTGATDEQIASLNAQAQALQNVGVVTAGNITQTQSQLATFNLQTDTIKALTPAILDYVTAEKGANASADEFKQMTNGLAQALNGNFGSLTRVGFVLDDHTKKLISSGTEAQRSAAIVDVLNSTYKDFNKELRNTPEGRMQVLRNDFDQLKEDLGTKLLPALKVITDFLTDQVIPGLRSFGKFIKENSTVIITLTAAILGGVAAYKAYLAIQKLVAVATTVLKVAQVLFTGATLASIASTNGLAASMLMLNAAMRNNPIGIIVTAIGLLVAGFIVAYKQSETFRNGVAVVAKAVLSFVALMVRAFGGFIEILLKVVTGPLRLFLGVMSKIPGLGNAAKAGLKLVNGAIEGVGNFAESTAAKIEGLKDKVDAFTASANKAAQNKDKTPKDKGDGKPKSSGGAKELTDAEKKKLEGYKKNVTDIYKDITKAIENANKKASEAVLDRDEDIAKARKRFAEESAKAEQTRDRSTLEAQKDLAKKKLEIAKDYAEQTKRIQENLDDKLSDLREKASAKITDLNKSALERQASIVQQSIDRLRNAFASKTGFDIAEAFKEGGSANRLIATLKDKLQAAKELQENAAALAGLGYSQVFIEEIVKNGPEAGNEIANALKNASPEATKELQALYNQVENISAHGLDALATTMNAGANLATEELLNAYNQVSVDLKEALETVNVELHKNMADAQIQFDKAMVEAVIKRDEALATAEAALEEALAKIRQNFDDSMIDASKSLTDALLDAQKQFEKAIQDIADTITTQLNDLMAKLAAAASAMNKIQSGAGGGVVGGAPTFGGLGGFGTSVDATKDPNNILKYSNDPAERAAAAAALGITITNNIDVTNATSPADIANAIMIATKYGLAVSI
jgi:hypothetical protein